MKSIALTFDYEIFFGKSGSALKCILEPTDHLLRIFRNYNFKATFFIDILYYQRLLTENEITFKDAARIKRQIQQIITDGHRIEPHLHTHWIDAEYLHPEWKFNSYRHYKVQSFSNEEILEIFSSSIGVLNQIAQEVDYTYKVTAFRAGGYCIQPFERLKKSFSDNNILYDSSVALGYKNTNPETSYDFKYSVHLDHYSFSIDPTKAEKDGMFKEFPIFTFNDIPLINKLFRYFNPLERLYGDGSGMQKQERVSFYKMILHKMFRRSMLSLDDTNPIIFKMKIRFSKFSLITIISHPKAFSNYTVQNLDILKKIGLETVIFSEIEFVKELISD
jgi:hypothetical protein